ncbi:hypothetical protein [Bacillus cytotoxicus]|uniref:hypothetical protein n=1 Tax=Bacillus cytotoxicus TaxID=580165 RepID=UPI0008644CEE|nr:hypothetical protein [Bacillus cytotoxicus]AWC29269.1 hypothetical protein CG483_013670 [Bacillus cytotoxicus]AWC41395.1 hypothetical protein CG480_013670 [Bacillus cytotoxicus]AWC49326.1 hypothetical protein CG478_013670 [Bacillus cytotoxicus]AWC53341.1 hypothetical protein CG477_013630 [Bacillus cytotoxicus]AWC57468.1 hypothetical protein CG476_013655 [Bacillus cytotoxicus]
MKCQHKWIDMEDGTNDKFCVKCSQKAKQMQITLPISLPISINADEWEAEFYRKRGIGIDSIRNSKK